ncbi:hypothetical protein KRR40_11710 [Niabella defluvii]|nr:hypothetical protein KRR40_11710 [Niabella sp. I65]
MNMLPGLDDTIVALATAPGVSAIGVIRLSGADAIHVADTIFRGKNLLKQASHTIHFGHIISGDEVIDEVVVSLYLDKKAIPAKIR